jgi:flagellin-like protein
MNKRGSSQLTRISNVRKTTKFKRSIKAISPVIATLLMIAIAVVASLVVYAWVSGYIGGSTSKAGNSIQIQSFAALDGKLVVYVQNVGQGTVELKSDQSVYVNGDLVTLTDPMGTITIPEGQTVQLTTGYSPSQGERLNIKVTTSSGTFTQATGKATNTAAPAPIANDDTYTVTKNQVLTVPVKGVLSNDLYVNTVVLPIASSTSHGTVSVLADGSFVYTPTTDYTGDDSFTYQATDGTTTTSVATVIIHVVTAPAVLNSFDITAPDSVTQNAPFTLTITAKDQYSGVLQSYAGPNTITVTSGTINPTDATTFSSGVWTSDQVTLSATGTITITTTGNTKTGTIDITVNAPAAKYYVDFQLGTGGDSMIPADGSHIEYSEGEEVSLTATAATGNHFKQWTATGTITIANPNSATTAKATINSAGTITATFDPDLVQYSVTFTYTTSGGGTPTAPTVQYLQSGETKTVTAGPSATVTVDAGSTYTYQNNPLTGSGTNERWQAAATPTGTISAAGTINPTYYHQYREMLSYSVNSGTGNGNPTFTSNVFGISTPQTLTTTSTGYWFDAGAGWTISQTLSGAPANFRWALQTTTGTLSSSTAWTNVFAYYRQVSNTFSVAFTGGNPGTGDTLVLTGTLYGTSSTNVLTLNVGGVSSASSAAWTDYNTAVTFPANTANSGSSERWARSAAYTSAQLTTGGGTISPSSNYYHQYSLTVTASPSGAIGGTFQVTYYQFGSQKTNEAHTTAWSSFADASSSQTATVSSPQSPYNSYLFSTYTGNGATMSTSRTITINYTPIVGNGNIGSTSQSIESGRLTGGRFTCSQSGTATNIVAYLSVTNNAHNMRAAIYSTSGARLGYSSEVSVAVTAGGWTTFTFTGTAPTLTAGTDYIIVIWSADVSGSANLFYSTTGGTGQYYSGTYGIPPASVTFLSDSTRNYSIYCTIS